ncbi:hypothetical protein FJT64_010953 [Amphibalanus amphitrite]|uniref:Uncharacterized protein n=1 Tax=Amphibalanus amphitrite TaxID=1232801 RepID=A0A6A4VK23_AMPAM|nr:hypothetical protein FJT64_010953 [Amphibalanus amphitrite]
MNDSGNAVFSTGHVVDIAYLLSRNCAADTVDLTEAEHQALQAARTECEVRAAAGSHGDACDGVPYAGRYYICMANRLQQLDAAGTQFDLSAFRRTALGDEDGPNWSGTRAELFSMCIGDADIDLLPRQQAVYVHACLRWSLSAACDVQQAHEMRLDDKGRERLSRFLTGQCPMSPSQLLDAYGLITSRTWPECSRSLAGAAAGDGFSSAVSQVTCLLQDFQTEDGALDATHLKSAVSSAPGAGRSSSTGVLKRTVNACGETQSLGEFVMCWAARGILTCVFGEANQLARQFPPACTV